jgi:hypothetical protein
MPTDRCTDGRTDGQTDRQTDRHTDMTKPIVAFRNFANASKNCCEKRELLTFSHLNLSGREKVTYNEACFSLPLDRLKQTPL